ncbi:hypothetical protein BLD44_021225 [Mastigocladus laminosus UU774]|nr:hypothetical protein B4U84_25065 [Westiellopsis prolifica IICB1]TFI52468.1 hypothetical protein BLD44_021225 [Mastigocladus laminosus UU774]
MKMILGNSKTFVLDAIYRVSTLDSYRDSATPSNQTAISIAGVFLNICDAPFLVSTLEFQALNSKFLVSNLNHREFQQAIAQISECKAP